MKKSLGVHPYLFPMPVLMIATYDEKDTVNVMNMAWGGICEENQVALNLSPGHKTVKNLKLKGAFTISIADAANVAQADFFGIASGNKMADKFARSGLHAVKSGLVDAPVVTEFPITLECKMLKMVTEDECCRVVGEILNVLAEENVLDENGRVDPLKVNALVFDPFLHGYYTIGDKAGQAWQSGKGYMED